MNIKYEVSYARSWLVTKRDGVTIQVNGNHVMEKNHGVSFLDKDGYLLCWFHASDIEEIEVMSQVTGHGNGYLPTEKVKQ